MCAEPFVREPTTILADFCCISCSCFRVPIRRLSRFSGSGLPQNFCFTHPLNHYTKSVSHCFAPFLRIIRDCLQCFSGLAHLPNLPNFLSLCVCLPLSLLLVYPSSSMTGRVSFYSSSKIDAIFCENDGIGELLVPLPFRFCVSHSFPLRLSITLDVWWFRPPKHSTWKMILFRTRFVLYIFVFESPSNAFVSFQFSFLLIFSSASGARSILWDDLEPLNSDEN